LSIVITKLIPKSVNLEGGGNAFGGLSQSDVAAALVSLDHLQLLLIDCYHLKIIDRKGDLVIEAAKELFRKGVPLKIIPVMATVLIDDLLDSTCKSCNGTRFNREAKECGMCSGTGKKGLSLRDKAEALGTSTRTLVRLYSRKYKEVLQKFEFICNSVDSVIRHKIG